VKTKPKNKKLTSNLTILILVAVAILVTVIIGSALQGTHTSAPSTGTGTSTAPSSLGTGYVIPAFSAMDLQGNIIDNSFFAKQRLTMVNVWGTFCGPCIREMPDLAQLPSAFPSSDFALLGIIADTNVQRTDANKATEDTARQQMSAAGASYPSIIPDASIMQHPPGQCEFRSHNVLCRSHRHRGGRGPDRFQEQGTMDQQSFRACWPACGRS